MTITLYSPNFHPLTGGLENVVLDLATEFTLAGHEVRVITLCSNPEPDRFPFRVFRKPGFWQQVELMRTSGLVMQFNVSLKGLIPWLFSGRPLVVSHQTANTPDLRGRLKTLVADRLAALNIACSRYMAAQFRHAETIPNPYNHHIFCTKTPREARSTELLFVGRLVSDKGAMLLLEALSVLKKEGSTPRLTIVGSGPEELPLRRYCGLQQLEEQVAFAGTQKGDALAQTMNAHRVLVVPSVWEEPFGIVALEGLACGCLVIGSEGGGLPEAIGGHGLLFPNNNRDALADRLRQALRVPDAGLPQPETLAAHLQKHTRRAVAQAYLDLLTDRF